MQTIDRPGQLTRASLLAPVVTNERVSGISSEGGLFVDPTQVDLDNDHVLFYSRVLLTEVDRQSGFRGNTALAIREASKGGISRVDRARLEAFGFSPLSEITACEVRDVTRRASRGTIQPDPESPLLLLSYFPGDRIAWMHTTNAHLNTEDLRRIKADPLLPMARTADAASTVAAMLSHKANVLSLIKIATTRWEPPSLGDRLLLQQAGRRMVRVGRIAQRSRSRGLIGDRDLLITVTDMAETVASIGDTLGEIGLARAGSILEGIRRESQGGILRQIGRLVDEAVSGVVNI